MKKIVAFASAVVFTMACALTASATVVLEKDFKADQTLEPFKARNESEVCSYEFTADGLRLYDITDNYKSYIIPFGKSGMEMNSGKNYLITFVGKANVDDPSSYEMIIQLFGKTGDGSDDWQGVNGKDGRVVGDQSAYPINDDGTFYIEAVVQPDQIEFDNHAVEQVCVWGKYGGDPKDYTIEYVSIEECDAEGNVEGGSVAAAHFAGGATETADVAATAGNTDAAATSTKGSADTGIEGVAVMAGMALLATGAVVISRKRK